MRTGSLELLLRLARGLERSGRGRERDEEGVALRVDLDAAVPVECLAQHAAVLGETPRVVLGAESCRSRVDPSMSVNRKVTVPRGSSRHAPSLWIRRTRSAVAAALGPQVRELAERDHEQEHEAGAEHQEDDLAPLLRGRLFGEQHVEHAENLPSPRGRRRGRRSSPSSCRTPTSRARCGRTNAVLRP